LLVPLWLAAQPSAAQGAKAPCVTAKQKVDYGRVMRVSPRVAALVERYRQGWRRACAGKGGASLNALLLQAERLRTAFDKITNDALRRTEGKGEERDRLRALYDRLESFLPAFKGVAHEFQFFATRIDVFARHARLGDPDDRRFFANYRLVIGRKDSVGDDILAMSPWRKHASTHASCLRFGAYPWATAVRRFDRLRGTLKGAYYRKIVDQRRNALRGELRGLRRREKGKLRRICTCGAGAATVVSDLRKLLPVMLGRHGYGNAARSVRNTITGVRRGRIPVRSRSCSDS
jgi:hypothetical protein